MKMKLSIIVLTMFLAGLMCGLPASAASPDVAVVVNPANNTASLSMGELRKIFNGEKRSWAGGASIKLLVRSSGHERGTLLTLLGMSESDYKQYWTSQIYKGEAQSEPVALPSNGMQKEALSVYPGAIALIDAAELKPGMKVLKIDGHLPGESNYPLH
jgi:ABC-type phosphate transport system substrate-binding protein